MKELEKFNYDRGIKDKILFMDELRFSDPLKTIELAGEFRQLAEDRDDINLMGYADFYIGDAYYTLGEFDNSINYLNKAAREFEESNNPYKSGGCLNTLGILYATRGEIIYALDNLKEAARIAESSEDDFVAALAYANYAEISDTIKDPSISMEYAIKAYNHIVRCASNPRQKSIEIVILTTLAKIYLKIGLTVESKKKIEQVEEIVNRKKDLTPCIDFYVIKLMYVFKTSNVEEERESALRKTLDVYYNTEYKIDYYLYIIDLLHFLKRIGRKDILIPLVEDFDNSIKDTQFVYLQSRIVDFKISLYDEDEDKELLYKELLRYRKYTKSYKMLEKRSIRRYISIQNNLEDSKRANELLKEQIGVDELTGLSNRWQLNTKVEELLNRAIIEKKNFAVEMLDIDKFKNINDQNGHHVGDLCLVIVASVLKNMETDGIHVFRYGGDEFLIYYLGYSDEEIEEKARTMRNSILEISEIRDLPNVYISQGICSGIPNKETKIWDFSSQADSAMYMAKRGLGDHIKLVKISDEI